MILLSDKVDSDRKIVATAYELENEIELKEKFEKKLSSIDKSIKYKILNDIGNEDDLETALDILEN